MIRTWAFWRVAAYVLLAAVTAACFLLVTKAISDIEQEGKDRRADTCEAFHNLYAAERLKIAADDIRFQSGAFDKVLPAFSSPEIKRLTHQNAVRRFNSFDNSRLPSYCPQRRLPEEVPRGFER